MLRIFAAGTPTTDWIIPLSEYPDLTSLAKRLCPNPGDKQRILSDTAKEIMGLLHGYDKVITAPGGSAPNTLLAMRQLLGSHLSATLLTAMGTDENSMMLTRTLREGGISLEPGILSQTDTPVIPAVSFVFLFPDGDRRIANYPGTIREHTKNLAVRAEDVHGADAVMLFGSTRETFGTEVFDTILTHRWRNGNPLPLLFSLPTNHHFARENQEYLKFLLGSVNVLVGNREELEAFLQQITEHTAAVVEHQRTAIEVLAGRQRHGLGNISPMAFITEGSAGATIISAKHGQTNLRPADLKNPKLNTLGAGDVTTGTFYAAILAGMPPPAAATLAMAAGAITVEYIGTVPPNLAEELARREPVNWTLFTQCRDRMASAAVNVR